MSYSIVIPAYNEADSIGRVLKQLVAAEPTAELIVVDDCSSDQTAEIVKAFSQVRVVSHAFNQGPIQAIVTGVRTATHEVVVTLDADGQHPIDAINRVVAPILNDQADLVLGSRESLPRLGEKIIATFSGVKDATTGFRAMKKELISLLEADIAYGGQYIVKARRNGWRISEVPITVQARLAGFSVHSNFNILKKAVAFAWWRLTTK